MHRRNAGIGLALFGVAAALCLPLLGCGFSFDQGVFSTIADTLLRGGVAYRDAWEHKPPGVFYVYYLSFLLIHREIWAVRLVEIAAVATAAALLFFLVRRRSGSPAAGAVASVMLPLSYLAFGDNTAQPETFQIPLLIGALLAWPESGDPAPRARCFASGLLLSAAVLFKTPAILFLGPLLGERLLHDRTRNTLGGRLGPAALTLAGLIVLPLLLVLYYACRGAGPALVDALFVYPRQYVAVGLRRSIPSHLEEFGRWTQWLLPPSSLLLIALGIVRGALVRGRETLRWALFFLTSFATVVLQGRYFEYHFLPVVPAVAWGTALLLSRPDALSTTPKPRALTRALTLALLVAAAGQSLWYARSRWSSFGSLARFDAANHQADPHGYWAGQRDVARQIRAMTSDRDRIFIWGDEPLIYLGADRRMAGPNCHLMQVAPPWGGSDRLIRLLARFEKEPPQLIVVTSHRLWWRDGQSPDLLLEYYPEMQQFLDGAYVAMSGPEGYRFWLRRPAADSQSH
jgi:hypothetical protein